MLEHRSLTPCSPQGKVSRHILGSAPKLYWIAGLLSAQVARLADTFGAAASLPDCGQPGSENVKPT
jgi:hypothetical protein